MQPLLKIQNIPINIQYTTKRASLQQSATPPTVNVTRNRGRANIQTTPAKVNLDSHEARASMGLKSPARSIREFGEAGVQAAKEATRTYADDGNRMLDSHGRGNPIADIAASKVMSTTETVMAFIPSVPVEMTPIEGSISFDYSMDQLTFDWSIQNRPQLEYVPGEVEFTVTQYPQVVIEYVGSPIYVPPSANPDYIPPAMDATA